MQVKRHHHPDNALRPTGLPGAVRRFAARFLRDQLGAIAPMFALLLIPIAGSIAYSAELGEWYYFQRTMQSAADSAALAAATNANGTGSGSTFQNEAAAAAKKYGFVNGTNNVAVSSSIVACPAGVTAGATCYQANVSTVLPLTFSRLINFNGSQALGSGRGQLVVARAIATSAGGNGTTNLCVWSLSTTGTSFNSNGGPKPDLAGCTIYSNGGMTCNGHNLGATYGTAAGVNSGCGITETSNAPALIDPYSTLPVPANSCGSYPQLPAAKKDPALPGTNVIAGAKSWTGNQIFCGDVQLSGDVTLSGTSTTVVIENGRLDLNGHTFMTAAGAAATIVFSGTNSSTYSHYPIGSGTLDIRAPTSGPLSGVAVFQDPALTTNVSFSYAGNNPTWDITGLVYLPKADVTFSGIVNKSSNGTNCFVLVSYTILINGTGQIIATNADCASAGLVTPSVGGGATLREKLVQ